MNTTTASSESPADSPGSGTKMEFRKVLVVDDDPAMRRIVSKILDSAGYEVALAANGSEAFEILQQDCPAFVVTDWDMPVLDGAALCRKIRHEELPRYVYIVMVTGTQSGHLVEGLASGADDFITKPVGSQELLARMQAGARVLRLENRLRLLADHDPLTELLNRRTFFELVEKELSRSRRIGYPLSCVMIDVDFFKKVNDTHGHMAGDAVLKSVSQLLKKCCRETDYVSRYGGEEFCALLPDTDGQGAVVWAERYRLAVAETPAVVAEISVQVTVSMGVAQRYHGTDTPEKLLDIADQALLEAKKLGRNRVVMFQPEMSRTN
jgi:diguanylate cyclase (GGDEF)-like protein